MNIRSNFLDNNTYFYRNKPKTSAGTKQPNSAFTIGADMPSPEKQFLASYSLNQEQVNNLRSRYDIENLTSKDMEQLLAELADMGTITKEDAKILNSRPIVTGAFERNETKRFDKGNALEWLSDSFSEFSDRLAWMTDPKTEGYLDSTFSLEKNYNISNTKNHMNRLEKILNVLNQIKKPS